MTTETRRLGPVAPSNLPSGPLSQGPLLSSAPGEGHRGPPAGGAEERIGDRLIALFWLAILLFCPLGISIFDRGAGTTLWGVPLLLVYLFGAWALIIAMLALVIEVAGGPLSTAAPTGPGADEADGPGERER